MARIARTLAIGGLLPVRLAIRSVWTASTPQYQYTGLVPVDLPIPIVPGVSIYAVQKKMLWQACSVTRDFFDVTDGTLPRSWNPLSPLLTAIDKWRLHLDNYAGFAASCGKRLTAPDFDLSIGRDGILLAAVSHPKNNHSINPHFVGIVELSIEIPDGTLPAPLPEWMRPNADISNMQPYLSNLCVLSSYRSKGIGRYLCDAVETLAHTTWQRNHMYLHVRETNIKAVEMYIKRGYKVVQKIDDFLQGDILYCMKELR